MIDYGADILSHHIWCTGQTYVQKEDIVYVIDNLSSKLSIFNISAGYLHPANTAPLSHPSYQYGYYGTGCLASIGDWIIYTDLNRTYIFTITNQSWMFSGNPIMSYPRTGHACTIEPHAGYLYVIGGHSPRGQYLDSIEKLYIKDIPNMYKFNFITLRQTSSSITGGTRAILYETDIYIIGDIGSDNIDVIDTTTDNVYIWGKLHEAMGSPSAIIIGTRVYIFGGWKYPDVLLNYWQYFDVFSIIFYYVCK